MFPIPHAALSRNKCLGIGARQATKRRSGSKAKKLNARICFPLTPRSGHPAAGLGCSQSALEAGGGSYRVDAKRRPMINLASCGEGAELGSAPARQSEVANE